MMVRLISELGNKLQNNISISQGEMKSIISDNIGSGWIRLHPESAGEEHSRSKRSISQYYLDINVKQLKSS